METIVYVVLFAMMGCIALGVFVLVIDSIKQDKVVRESYLESIENTKKLMELTNFDYEYQGWNINICRNPAEEGYLMKASKDGVALTDGAHLPEMFYSRHYGHTSDLTVERHLNCICALMSKTNIWIDSIERFGFENWKKENFSNGNK